MQLGGGGGTFSASDRLEPHRHPNQTRSERLRHIVSKVLYIPADSWLQTYLVSFPSWLQNPTEKPFRGVSRGKWLGRLFPFLQMSK